MLAMPGLIYPWVNLSHSRLMRGESSPVKLKTANGCRLNGHGNPVDDAYKPQAYRRGLTPLFRRAGAPVNVCNAKLIAPRPTDGLPS